jgi:hypothetical protein
MLKNATLMLMTLALATTAACKKEGAKDAPATDPAAKGAPADPAAAKAAPAAKKDDSALVDEAKAAGWAMCEKPPAEFTEDKMAHASALAGAVLGTWYNDAAKPRTLKPFVAKKAVVRSAANGETHIYIGGDETTDLCALPTSENMVSGPVVMTASGDPVIQVSFGGTAPGMYMGRPFEEVMANMMGGPPNWLGVVQTVKDPDVTGWKEGDKYMPYTSINSTGKAWLKVTKYEQGKVVEAELHACTGDKKLQSFLVGPISATWCPETK